MKKLLFAIIVLFMLSLGAYSATAEEIASGICGIDVTWSLDSDGTLTVSGNGDMLCNKDLPASDESEGFAIWVDEINYSYDEYIDSIKAVIVEEGVTAISPEAFSSADSLALVHLPATLTQIHDSAFSGCENIISVYHPDLTLWCSIIFGNRDSNPLFYGADLYINNIIITHLSIPETITTITAYSFCGCSSIQSVSIPKGITTIDDGAFNSCSALESITIPETMEYISIFAFSKTDKVLKVYVDDLDAWCNIDFAVYSNPLCCNGELYVNGKLATEITLPDTITSVRPYAFQGYELLTSVVIPEGVTEICNGAFYECTNLTTVTLPDSITSIEGNAFNECSSLSEVVIPEGVTGIEFRTFFNCINLKTVILPDSITSIGDSAFYNCSSLTSINLDNITSIESSAFAYCSDLKSVNMPHLSEVDYETFIYCSNLEHISIPSAVLIKRGAFARCDALDSVSLPSVVEIDEYAFYDCDNLTCVFLPKRLTSILNNAFTSLEIIYYDGTPEEWSALLSASTTTCNLDGITVYFNVLYDDFTSLTNASVQYSLQNQELLLSPFMIPKNSIIILNYTKDGICTTQTVIYDGSKEVIIPLSASYDNLKIHIWDSLQSMQPIVNKITIYN